MKYPLTKPEYDERELAAVKEVFDSGWLIDGPKVRDFEAKMSKYTHTKYAIATSSCTTALITAIKYVAQDRKGKSVIVPSFGWIATANAVKEAGLHPIFVDVTLDGVIDVSQIEKAITKDTIAIIAVHNCGIHADICGINDIALRYGLTVIEDSAGALGQTESHLSLCSCYSFHPRKVITTGEGGMITTNNKFFAEWARSYIYHGSYAQAFDLQNANKLSTFGIVGNNYRMTNMQGALGCVQMDKLDDILSGKRKILGLYIKQLVTDKLRLMPVYSNASMVAFLQDTPTLPLINYLLSQGIQSRHLSHSAPLEACYGYSPSLFPNANTLCNNTFCLPSYLELQENDIDYICSKVKLWPNL